MGRLRWAAVAAAAGVALVALSAGVVPGWAAGKAEMRVNGPAGTEAIGVPFGITVEITRTDVTWAGYNDQLLYDDSILQVNTVKNAGLGGCSDSSWGNPDKKPRIIAACVFQSSTATGVTENIEMQCLKDGTSELHLVTPAEDSIQGTALLAFDGQFIPTDLVDSQVTCGSGGPIETVAVPTNPPQSVVNTEIASGPSTPVPGSSVVVPPPGAPVTNAQGTPLTNAQGTPLTNASGTPLANAQGTPLTSAPVTNAQGTPLTNAQGTPLTGVIGAGTAVGARTAQAAHQDPSSGGGSSHLDLILIIVGAVVLVAAVAFGAFTLTRRGGMRG